MMNPCQIQELWVMDIQRGAHNHNNVSQLHSISVSKVLVREEGRGKGTSVLSARPHASHFHVLHGFLFTT